MLENLEERLSSLNLVYNEAKQLQDQYKKLIVFMTSNPPMTEDHIASMEQELDLSRKQLAGLDHLLKNAIKCEKR
jgi:hypothetical protein